MHLVDHARGHIERTWERPAVERVLRTLLSVMLPRPGFARLALMAARGPSLLAPLFRGRIGALLRLAARPSYGPSWVERPQVIPAEGKRRKRVALLTGCVQCTLAPEINEAAVRVLTRHGCEVVVARGAGCCGALAHHLGDEARGRAQAGRTAAAFAREAADGGLDAGRRHGVRLRDDAQGLRPSAQGRRSPWRRRRARGGACARHQRGTRRTRPRGPWRAAYQRACRLPFGLLAAAWPADRAAADGAPRCRRLHRWGGPGRALLLRLGRHLQYSAAGTGGRTRGTQGDSDREHRCRTRGCRQHRLAWCRSPATRRCRWCTRSSSSTGRPVGRVRRRSSGLLVIRQNTMDVTTERTDGVLSVAGGGGASMAPPCSRFRRQSNPRSRTPITR